MTDQVGTTREGPVPSAPLEAREEERDHERSA